MGREKGIDVRLALDVVRLAREGAYDVAVTFSQDQDLSEVADEVKQISIAQERWIKIACAFPASPTYSNTRGVNGTDWIRFDRALYDACIDRTKHRTPPTATHEDQGHCSPVDCVRPADPMSQGWRLPVVGLRPAIAAEWHRHARMVG